MSPITKVAAYFILSEDIRKIKAVCTFLAQEWSLCMCMYTFETQEMPLESIFLRLHFREGAFVQATY